MLPRLYMLGRQTQNLPIRSACARPSHPVVHHALQRRRFGGTSEKDAAERATGPNQGVLPHVSEEAAALGEITGEGGTELMQGTYIQDILKRDKESQEKAPKVLRDALASSTPKPGTRSYSTMITPRDAQSELVDSEMPIRGVKFGLPGVPLPANAHIQHRYDPIVQQITTLMMRDGKIGAARTNMALVLQHLRSASPPTINPSRPLLPGAPPPSHLPLNPVLYLTLAIDSVAPLLRIRSQRGAAGGGVALQIPVPLRLRQRRRAAFQWILSSVDKKPSRGSGKGQFAQRVAEEIVAVVEGRSAVWDRRANVHKIAVGARANVSTGPRRR